MEKPLLLQFLDAFRISPGVGTFESCLVPIDYAAWDTVDDELTRHEADSLRCLRRLRLLQAMASQKDDLGNGYRRGMDNIETY